MRKFVINVNGKSYEVEVEEMDQGTSTPELLVLLLHRRQHQPQQLLLPSQRQRNPSSKTSIRWCSAPRSRNY